MHSRRTFLGRLGALIALGLAPTVPPGTALAATPASAPGADPTPAAEPPPADGSHLDRPVGTDVAIVAFQDLQCPDCAQAHPRLVEVATREGVPLVIRDAPLARHDWAFPAALLARWFTLGAAAAGEAFRGFVYANQAQVTVANLRDAAEQFAKSRGIELPASVDPDGKLGALVQADMEFARLIGVRRVPTVFVVASGRRWAEVRDLATLGDVVMRFRRETERSGAR